MSEILDLIIDNICTTPEDIYSGVKCRLYYAPASFFFKTPLPSIAASFESEITVSEEIFIKNGKQLRYIDVLIDQNELKTALVGGPFRKKSKITLQIFILGLRASVLGFIERIKNEPLIFFIQDHNGNNWQIGNLINRAWIDTAEATTGKTYEDNSGVSISIFANTPIYLYTNSLDNFAKPGDFNTDFNTDFYTKNYD